MSTLTQAQATQYAQSAGFTGQGLDTIVAIAVAESGLRTDAQNTVGNTPQGSMDRGILQFNSYWHHDISDACAYDPQCSFQKAYVVTQGGTNFSQWATYQSGAYKNYLPGVSATTSASQTAANALSNVPVIGGILPGLQSSFVNFTEEAAVFLIALLLIILGIMLLAGKEIGGFTKEATGIL